MTHEEGDYIVGSDIEVTIHVFQDGLYADPPQMRFETVGYGSRGINLTRLSTGMYQASFTILEGDLEGDELVFRCSAFDEFTLAHEKVYVELATLLRLDLIVLDPEDLTPSPGDNVEVLARLSLNGTPVDADTDWMRPYASGSYGFEYRRLNATRLGTGLYSFNFTLPTGLTKSAEFVVTCYAGYTSGNTTRYAEDEIELLVDIFDVWVELVDSSNKSIATVLYVADKSGDPVSGATVRIEADFRAGEHDDETVFANGTTNDAGRVSLNLSTVDLYHDPVKIWIEGNVTKGGMVQFLWRQIYFSNPQRTWDSETDLKLTLLFDEPVSANTTLDLRYHADIYVDGNPLVNSTIIVYMYDENQMIYYGNLTTDANGNFTINVTTPPIGDDGITETSLRVWFQALVDDEWMIRYDWVVFGEDAPYQLLRPFQDEDITLDIDPMTGGRKVNITLDHPDADGTNETAWVYWGPGNPQMAEYFWLIPPPEWSLWDDTQNRRDVNVAPCSWNGSAYTAQITLPPWVPDEIAIHFAGVIEFYDQPGKWSTVIAIEEAIMFESLAGLPQIQMLSPVGGTYGGTILLTGTAHGDNGVVRVEVLIDELEIFIAEGTEEWSWELDTTTLDYGFHKIQVRATDGTMWSDLVEVQIQVNQPPVIAQVSVEDNETYIGVLVISGRTEDDGGVDKVTLIFDDDQTVDAVGTDEWSYTLDIENEMNPGLHKLEVIVTDVDGATTSQIVWFKTQYEPRPPMVTIVNPLEGSIITGTVSMSGTASGDDLARIEVQLNDGPWETVTGTYDWTLELDLSEMSPGEVTINARAIAGETASPIVTVHITMEVPSAVVEFSMVVNTDNIIVEGTASDGGEMSWMEYRIDGGDWSKILTADEWSFMVDTGVLDAGEYTLEVRSFDGRSFSDTHSETFEVEAEQEPEPEPEEWPWAMAVVVMAVAAISASLVLMIFLRKGKDRA